MRRRFSLTIPETLEDACDPAAMAVIVYDMQAGVVRQLPGGGAQTAERVSRVLTAARAGGYPVFFTRHLSLPARLMGAAQLRTAMAWQYVDDPEKVPSWFLRGTPGFRIVPDLSPRGDEAVFGKLAMSAFAGTPLEMARCCPALRPGEGSPLTRFRRPWSSVKSQSADKARPNRSGAVRAAIAHRVRATAVTSCQPSGETSRTARWEIPRRL